LLAVIEQTGRTLVHPFDDPHVIAGQGTVALEIVEDVPGVDCIVCPVGGGGLIAGVAIAVDCRVVGVEPERMPGFSAGLAAGRSVRIESQPTIADGLAPPFAGELALAAGMRFLYQRAKLACEPAGAAATAALLAGKVPLEPGSSVVAVVSGGNADPKVASAIVGAADEA